MLKNLFSSEVRIQLLNKFLMNPEQEFYLRELSNLYKISPRSVSLELQNLERIELIKKRISGKQHFYSINRQHPLYGDLRNIFIKTFGFKNLLQKYLEPYKSQISYCFIYGSIAKGNSKANSDLDLMIIGDVPSRKISGDFLKAGEELNREVNFSIFSESEFVSRLRNNDHFITTLIKEPKIFIIGDSIEFSRLGEK